MRYLQRKGRRFNEVRLPDFLRWKLVGQILELSWKLGLRQEGSRMIGGSGSREKIQILALLQPPLYTPPIFSVDSPHPLLTQ